MTVKDHADMAISMDADLQDDIDAIDAMVDKYLEGMDIVYGVRSSRKKDTFFKKATAEGFYKLMNAMGANTVFNHADYRLMSRRALEALAEYVRTHKLDAGVAFDGDADRCLAVDEKGEVVNGDHIMYIYGKHMHDKGQLMSNTVVTTIMSNFGLYKAFDELGIEYAKTAVGDKYVYEYMVNNGCRLGGEQSGHIIISKYATTGDGILTSLKIMEVMLANKKKLSQLTEGLTIYPQVLKNVRVNSKPEAQNDPAVQAAVSQVAERLGDTGRILVRESGTEPVIRVMVEAPSKELCQECVDQVVDVICNQGHARV